MDRRSSSGWQSSARLDPGSIANPTTDRKDLGESPQMPATRKGASVCFVSRCAQMRTKLGSYSTRVQVCACRLQPRVRDPWMLRSGQTIRG